MPPKGYNKTDRDDGVEMTTWYGEQEFFKRGEPIVTDKEEFFIDKTKDGDNETAKNAWEQFIMVATMAYGDDWQKELDDTVYFEDKIKGHVEKRLKSK